MADDPKAKWSARLREWLPGFLAGHPVLGGFADRGDAVLHGSTTFGFDDEVSDLDLWLLLPRASLPDMDAVSDTRFFGFELDGKEAHINAESAEEFADRAYRCDMVLLSERRTAEPIITHLGAAEKLIERARKPMREEVRRGLLFHHYVEVRSFHRNCDNPMFRGDAAAVLMTFGLTLAETLRCALIIDGEPYPYQKWLRFAAAGTRTGRRIVEIAEELLSDPPPNLFRRSGPEAAHPVNLALHAMRDELIAAAVATGIDEPWLRQWWLHMTQARSVLDDIRW